MIPSAIMTYLPPTSTGWPKATEIAYKVLWVSWTNPIYTYYFLDFLYIFSISMIRYHWLYHINTLVIFALKKVLYHNIAFSTWFDFSPFYRIFGRWCLFVLTLGNVQQGQWIQSWYTVDEISGKAVYTHEHTCCIFLIFPCFWKSPWFSSVTYRTCLYGWR